MIPFRVALAWTDNRDIDKAQEYAKRVQDRLRQISQGQWAVEVRAYLVEDMGAPGLNRFNYRRFSEFVDENDDFDPTHWLSVGGWHSGNCGEAKAGGKTSHAQRRCSPETGVHELLHNGVTRSRHLLHSGLERDEYGEGTLMGRFKRHDLSGPHLYQAGLIEPERINLDESRTVFLIQPSSEDA